jgi:hypothetical protein
LYCNIDRSHGQRKETHWNAVRSDRRTIASTNGNHQPEDQQNKMSIDRTQGKRPQSSTDNARGVAACVFSQMVCREAVLDVGVRAPTLALCGGDHAVESLRLWMSGPPPPVHQRICGPDSVGLRGGLRTLGDSVGHRINLWAHGDVLHAIARIVGVRNLDSASILSWKKVSKCVQIFEEAATNACKCFWGLGVGCDLASRFYSRLWLTCQPRSLLSGTHIGRWSEWAG